MVWQKKRTGRKATARTWTPEEMKAAGLLDGTGGDEPAGGIGFGGPGGVDYGGVGGPGSPGGPHW